jgi:hypothetical protein
MTAIGAGFSAGRAAYLGYDQEALAPLSAYQWDAYASRLFRYTHYRHYYNNTVYSELERYAVAHKEKSNQGLYRHVRPVYNPAARGVDLYPSKVYGGQLDIEELSSGAIPLRLKSDAQKRAIRQLWQWSNWGIQKSLYVTTGAMLGDVFIKLVDEPDKGRVRLEVQIPDIYKELEFNSVGSVTRYVIEYNRVDVITGKSYVYKEEGNKEWFRTYKDGELFAYTQDGDGKPAPEWRNIYGFVPVVHVPHKLTVGARFGTSSVHKVLWKIDEINSAASRVNDQIAKVVNTIYHAKGLQGSVSFELNDDKGQMPLLKTDSTVDLIPLVNNLDITAATDNVTQMLMEIERDMPELSLHRIRESGQATAPGVRAAYSDAIDLINEASGLYDDGLVRAHQMAMTIGGIRGYQDFTGFNEGSYDNGDLDHSIAPRDVIDDSLSQYEKVTFLMQAFSIPNRAEKKMALKELGYTEKEIEDVEKEAEEQDNAAAERDFQNKQVEADIARTNMMALTGGGKRGKAKDNLPPVTETAPV